MDRKKVVIIGGGFGGLNAAQSLKKADLDITLIDKTNHHLFQPLLYQVATAALSPGDIAAPIRGILNGQKNIRVIMSEAVSISPEQSKVNLSDGSEKFDYLIIATGSRHSYYGNDQWEKLAPGLKTLSDAINIRESILNSFETAEKLTDLKEITKHLTFVIVGGGPTGVEMAGAIAEITKQTMLKDFRNVNPLMTKIILIEGSERILGTYQEPLNTKAKSALENLGVTVILNSFVTDITRDGVMVGEEFINTRNVIWAAGNTANPLLYNLNVEHDKFGRTVVERDCSIKGYENIFVIGDAALLTEGESVLPGIAPVAIQQGRYVAEIIARGIIKSERKPFRYFDKGSMATIGRGKAVMQLGNFKLAGFAAWVLWGVVHIMFLISYRNKYKVMAEWLWYYITKRQGIRLITHQNN
ncbi:MAG: NAD(P)/FAD-dependent oxidoreductase [Melioribacteraceae bacterium]|nr:NAD(P)/FAD-dependent oxidoreductase [Melioribacteraceae bacterium]